MPALPDSPHAAALGLDLGLDARDRTELRERIASVRTLRGRDAPGIVGQLSHQLHELMDAPSLVARPVRKGEGYALDFVAARGVTPTALKGWSEAIRSAPRGAFLYDPARPAPGQRNAVHEIAMDDPSAAQGAMTALRAMGIGHSTQVRTLVCDGPLLLGFLGGYLPPGRPVTDRDRARLHRFAMGVRPVLRLLAGVEAKVTADALDTMMEAYPGEAYLVHGDGRIACANTLGARILDERGADAQLEIQRAVRGDVDSPYDVHPVRRTGMFPMSLLTRAAREDSGLEQRLARAQRAWSLSPRELEVLRALANGSANKDIAALIGISLRTVEVHITALLRKARAASRLELVVTLWKGA
jgi:DNA-binding CsgD family transcriptional regulator